MEELLKKLAFSDKQIAELTAEETTAEQKNKIIKEWQSEYNKVIIENPKVEKHFREQLAPNLLAEGRSKERKKIVEALGLTITKTKAVDMEEDEWTDFLKKSNVAKTDDTKIDELNSRIADLIKEKELLEDSITDKLATKDKEWKQKIVDAKWKSIRSEKVSSLKDLVIDSDELSDIIELKRQKKGFNIDVDEAGNILAVDADGKKFYEDGKPLNISDWIDANTSNYVAKSNGAPQNQPKNDEPVKKDNNLTPAQIRLAEMRARHVVNN